MSIECPRAGIDVKVTPQGTGPGGTICAHGGVDAFKEGAVTVIVKVYAGNNPTLPSTPEGVPATLSGTHWFVANLAVPNSSSTAPGAQLTISAWTVAGSSVVRHDVLSFGGLVGGGTDCCAGSFPGVPQPQPVGAVALAMAPILWSVCASGFGAGAALFNGEWLLTLRQTLGGFCVWDNGGAGNGTPWVELRCESPLTFTWQLTLRNGSDAVLYTLPAAQWNQLNSNLMRLSSNGFPLGTVPESLTVKPG